MKYFRHTHHLLTVNVPVISLLLLLTTGLTRHVCALLYPFKLIHNASHEATLTPQEWNSEFRCAPTSGPTGGLEHNGSLPLECYRDENYWLYKHIDEIHDQFKLLVQQDSLDERFADKVFMVNGHTGLDYHHYKFNTGDPRRDRLLQKYAAGAQVDDKLCKLHLKQMVDLLEDFRERTERKRSGNATLHEHSKLDERHFRLARVLDSFGRYESGQLNGRYHSFGVYHECVRTPMLLAAGEKLVNSRYCWARLGLDRHLSEPLRGRGVMNMRWGDFAFHLATCLPASCHSKSFSGDQENLKLVQRLIDSQYEAPDSMYLERSLPVESVFCLVDLDSKVARMPLSGILFVTFLLGWTTLCLVATYMRRHSRNLASCAHNEFRARKSPWSHLDLLESFYEFVGECEPGRRTPGLVDLDSLNFVKCLCTLLVVVAHSCLLTSPLSFTQLQMQASMETERFESFAMFGFVLVDTFFVVSGLMVAYVSLRRFARAETRQRQLALDLNQQQQLIAPATMGAGKRKMVLAEFGRQYSPASIEFYKAWLLMTAGRYFRLVPLFLMAFWFKKGFFVWLGSGPLWDYGLNRDTQIGGCQHETWLTPFTPLSAYLPAPRQCVPQSWSISNDLSFALWIPPLILLLYKRPQLAHLYALAGYALATYFGFVTYYNLDARLRFMLEQMRNHSVIILFQVASYAYAIPSYRVPAILAGTMAGYALYRWEQRRLVARSNSAGGEGCAAARGKCTGSGSKNLAETWPWWLRWLATPLALAFISYAMGSSFFLAEMRKSASGRTREVMPIYMLGFHHTLWSVANAIVFLRMVSDWRNLFTVRLLAGRFFKVTSHLSYAFLLVHWDILLFDALIEPQASEFSRWNYFKSLGTSYLYSVLVAGPVHLIFERPIGKLTKTYLLGS